MTSKTRTIGVLAVQGAFALHRPHIEALGSIYAEVTSARDLARVDALILPGGESGVMLKLLAHLALDLRPFLRERPAWGICAGAILLAREVTGPSQPSFGALDVAVARNAYGRQRESSTATIAGYEVSLIRAPKIVAIGAGVAERASLDGVPVWVESGNKIATTFHPETNTEFPSPWHRRLVDLA